jgi:hypothetical protein
MACPTLEDLLSGKSGNHVLHCQDCRALLDALVEIDSVFESAFAGISAPADLAAAVRSRISSVDLIRRPSPIPEFLDLIGWAAVFVIAAIILPRFVSVLSSIWTVLG